MVVFAYRSTTEAWRCCSAATLRALLIASPSVANSPGMSASRPPSPRRLAVYAVLRIAVLASAAASSPPMLWAATNGISFSSPGRAEVPTWLPQLPQKTASAGRAGTMTWVSLSMHGPVGGGAPSTSAYHRAISASCCCGVRVFHHASYSARVTDRCGASEPVLSDGVTHLSCLRTRLLCREAPTPPAVTVLKR